MDDAFAAPDAEPGRDPTTGMTADGMLTIVMAMFIVAAGLSGAFMGLTAMATVLSLVVDIPTEPGEPPLHVIAPIECAFCALPTMLYTAAAVGVYRRQKWGFVLGLIGLAFWMGGCLMPVGLFGFYALLREEGRRAFGFG